MRSVARDLGLDFSIHLWSDAAAAIGIARRKGLGRVRHLAVSDLWIQDKLREGVFSLSKIPGQLNPADLLTKYVNAATIHKHLTRMGTGLKEGRAGGAPQLTEGQVGTDGDSDAESDAESNKEKSAEGPSDKEGSNDENNNEKSGQKQKG